MRKGMPFKGVSFRNGDKIVQRNPAGCEVNGILSDAF